jgi:hypothetical protein
MNHYRVVAMNKYVLVLFFSIIGFTIIGTNIIIAQPSQSHALNNSTLASANTTESDDKYIILTWLKSNETESGFTIDKHHFWEIFKASNNLNMSMSKK